MGDNSENHDRISKKIQTVCEKFHLRFVDPKQDNLPGDILQKIQTKLNNARLVIADVTEVNNPNVFYEVGYVYGMFPQKLVLIADKEVVDSKLPFDIRTQAVLKYSRDVWDFEKFISDFETTLKTVLEQNQE